MDIVIWCDTCLDTVTVNGKSEVWRVLDNGWTLRLSGEKNYYGQCADCIDKRSGYIYPHEVLQ